ncbi:MAG TPA: flagellar biosynthetic protein FliR [Stellaceae bacterium]|nr:flagellar biosynthetic protein FliR [Stellaceae bacterium]
MLAQLIPANLFAAFLVFSRIGTAMSFLPGFSDLYVPTRVRLVMALAITVLLTPVLSSTGGGLPALPTQPMQVFLLVGGEIVVGLFLGLISRILMAALETAGMIISLNMNLSNALIFNPAQQTQESLAGSLMALIGVTLLFVTDLHHLMLSALVDSYSLFRPGMALPMADMSRAIAMMVGRSFTIAIELAAPFMIIGVAFYAVAGLLSRLMPQLQIFFVALPLQIMGGFAMLTMTLSAIMLWYLKTFQDVFLSLARP